MEKELHEHPAVIGDTLHQMINPGTRAVALPALPFDLAKVSRVTVSACGSAFYAGMVGRWWFESVARIPADGDVASEFRYRTPPMPPGGLGLLVSQSGETADTLAALRYMRDQGQHTLAVVNVAESTMARRRDAVLQTVAGPEDRGRQHQGVHRPAVRARLPGAGRRTGARRAVAGTGSGDDGRPAGGAGQGRRDPGARRRHRPRRGACRRGARRAVPRPRRLLPDRHGGRAEAEGDQLHPRRGLRRRRDEARPDRADRPQRAGRSPSPPAARCSRRPRATCRKRRRAAAR